MPTWKFWSPRKKWIPAVYKLEQFVINTRNTFTATALVLSKTNGEPKVLEVSTGDGPVYRRTEAIEDCRPFLCPRRQVRSVTKPGCPG